MLSAVLPDRFVHRCGQGNPAPSRRLLPLVALSITCLCLRFTAEQFRLCNEHILYELIVLGTCTQKLSACEDASMCVLLVYARDIALPKPSHVFSTSLGTCFAPVGIHVQAKVTQSYVKLSLSTPTKTPTSRACMYKASS